MAVIASECNERSNLQKSGSSNRTSTKCHCERVQRAKQSAKHKLVFSLFLAEFPVIIGFLLKKRQVTAKAWQIASLVALARNDSRLFKNQLSENLFR